MGYTIQHRLDSDLTDLIYLISIRCGIFNYDMLHVTISDGWLLVDGLLTTLSIVNRVIQFHQDIFLVIICEELCKYPSNYVPLVQLIHLLIT